jgi:hypothetical protein
MPVGSPDTPGLLMEYLRERYVLIWPGKDRDFETVLAYGLDTEFLGDVTDEVLALIEEVR